MSALKFDGLCSRLLSQLLNYKNGVSEYSDTICGISPDILSVVGVVGWIIRENRTSAKTYFSDGLDNDTEEQFSLPKECPR